MAVMSESELFHAENGDYRQSELLYECYHEMNKACWGEDHPDALLVWQSYTNYRVRRRMHNIMRNLFTDC